MEELRGRLGLDVPKDAWLAPALLRAYEAAGFAWVQLRTPPRDVLCDPRAAFRHAEAVHDAMAPSTLRLVVHGPDDLSAGTPEHDAALDGLLDYAAGAGAQLVVYHGANFDKGEWWAGRGVAEERALRRCADRVAGLGLTLAVENLCSVFGGTDRMSHAPLVVRDLVRRLDHPAVGMLLDIGHAHVATGASARVLEACAEEIVLFHVHDNLGRDTTARPAHIDPLRLDLHLAPGQGTVPWSRLATGLLAHGAPLVAEVAPEHRPPIADLSLRCAAALAGRPVSV